MIPVDFADLCSGCMYIESSSYVMQYTGVHDESADEKEIYEEDKIKFIYESTEYVGIVKFEAGTFILACDDFVDGYIPFLELINSDRDYWWIKGEIVGNIYENPERLSI